MSNPTDNILLVLTANTCQPCREFKKAGGEFEKLKGIISNIPGLTLINEVFQTTSDRMKKNEVETKYLSGSEVTGFPSIYLITNGRLFKYGGRRSADAILEWAKTNFKPTGGSTGANGSNGSTSANYSTVTSKNQSQSATNSSKGISLLRDQVKDDFKFRIVIVDINSNPIANNIINLEQKERIMRILGNV